MQEITLKCIKGATLLSKEEYEKYKISIPKKSWGWWLRSAEGDDNCASIVVNNNVYAYPVNTNGGGIRPALILDIQSSNLDVNIGYEFNFGEYTFTIISNDLAICNDFIDRGCFREDQEAEDANIYEKSDVKKVVDKWFKEAYLEKDIWE